MRHLAWWGAALGCTLIACASAENAQCASIHTSLATGQARLDAISREIAESEARAARAKANADFMECRSVVAEIKSEAVVRIATCLKDRAQSAECKAEGDAKSAEDAVAGCLAGIIFAAVTVVGAPVALLGCAAGKMIATLLRLRARK